MLDTQLKRFHEIRVARLDILDAVRAGIDVLSQILDELVGLVLRIDHEWPSARSKDDDGVFNGQVVTGQLCHRPGFNCDGIFHDLLHAHSF